MIESVGNCAEQVPAAQLMPDGILVIVPVPETCILNDEVEGEVEEIGVIWT